MPHKASIMNENEMNLLHCLVSRSKRLSMKSLHLLIDAYPESITSADKYGMIPFHYAWLNKDMSVYFNPEVVGEFFRNSVVKKNKIEAVCKNQKNFD